MKEETVTKQTYKGYTISLVKDRFTSYWWVDIKEVEGFDCFDSFLTKKGAIAYAKNYVDILTY